MRFHVMFILLPLRIKRARREFLCSSARVPQHGGLPGHRCLVCGPYVHPIPTNNGKRQT